MSGRTKQPSGTVFGSDLDKEVSPLPGRSWKSLLGFFAHLESISSATDPSVETVLRGLNGKTARAGAGNQWLGYPSSHGVSYRDLGRQIIRSTHAQVRALQDRLERMQALVLINNWSVAEKLWSEIIPHCKTPLYAVSLLAELWGFNPDRVQVDGWSLKRQWQEFVLIQAEFEILLGRRRSLTGFSDALERDFGHWLVRFDDLLDKLDEASVP